MSLTSAEDLEWEWNVGLPPLLWHLAQLGRKGCQLCTPAALQPQGNSLVVITR